jgi:hypothetical protein
MRSFLGHIPLRIPTRTLLNIENQINIQKRYAIFIQKFHQRTHMTLGSI